MLNLFVTSPCSTLTRPTWQILHLFPCAVSKSIAVKEVSLGICWVEIKNFRFLNSTFYLTCLAASANNSSVFAEGYVDREAILLAGSIGSNAPSNLLLKIFGNVATMFLKLIKC